MYLQPNEYSVWFEMALVFVLIVSIVAIAWCAYRLVLRIQLSLAKHRSLLGHSRWAKRLAKLVPATDYDEVAFFACDTAPDEISQQRQTAFLNLAEEIRHKQPQSIALAKSLRPGLSDSQLLERNHVPFQFRRQFNRHFDWSVFIDRSEGVTLLDVDGNRYFDLAASYGINVFGYQNYSQWMQRAQQRVADIGPVLGPQHALVLDNVQRLCKLSGMDEVSFHMSGTEAVMQAVRLARFNSGRSHLVRFCGAYNGWWDDAQPGIGNPTNPANVYTLAEMSRATLKTLSIRRDIACVIINPIQAMHPNANAPGDAMLVASDRSVDFDRVAYTQWLKELRAVCTRRNIALIFDEVFVGFRIALGGAQEYFGVQADLVTYGKTLGGGYPVGVVCGKAQWMKRYDERHPSNICFARGTFNAHPTVMAAMNEFLQHVDEPTIRRQYQQVDKVWGQRAEQLNQAFSASALPIRCVNMVSVFTLLYTQPSRYNWMLQVYLRAAGLYLGLPGTGRLIFSHNYGDEEFDQVVDRIVDAAERMRNDGWWWRAPAQSNQSIRKQVLLEMLGTRFGLRI